MHSTPCDARTGRRWNSGSKRPVSRRPCTIRYRSIEQPAYAHFFPNASFPVSEALAREVLSLPMHPYLDEATQRRIVDAVRTASGARSAV